MKKIALILPYFGKFKNYFPLFLESCKYNSSIDFFVFSDSIEGLRIPSNVFVMKCSFEEFSDKVQEKFNFKISLASPYKLCDYKPAFGEILSKELKGYDYWGHCDCDLIFGDLRKFVNDEILEQYDKIFTRGHLTIYKNIPEINSFYRSQKDYKTAYQTPVNLSFDEWPGISRICAGGGYNIL